ncbi:hypothetical protein DENIS_2241 [Desulfonema ishimotonii]|uniref:Uncharacterized protein n=2 Tax=Desulfonema ishimotonii TaxID=45657 RepID=A0A401FWE6_9BACT|nr:hypothetical protein DENIS_2241 [Desulfonema ishimotonii]
MEKKNVNKLLVLKAFYLGRALSDHEDKNWAIDVINKAIEQLGEQPAHQSKVRLLFYLLLKAEINRQSDNVFEIREYAKEVATDLGGEIFHDFMLIENATQTLKRAYGLEKGFIADQGVKNNIEFKVVGFGYKKHIEYYDIACKAVGIDPNKLSDKDFNFLHKVTLTKMLESHCIKGIS